jgi:hypothetical protein
MDYQFPNNESNNVYSKAYLEEILDIAPDFRDQIALLKTHLFIANNRTHYSQEELNRHLVIIQTNDALLRTIETARKKAESKVKLELALRKEKTLTYEDVQEVLAKICKIFMKFVPKDKQSAVISELQQITAAIKPNI